MTDDIPSNPALLPAGLRDILPPEAETEASAVEALMEAFAAHGYQRVKPPLMEYEDSLLAGTGAAVAEQTFRLMDPDTHRMVGLRADMTPQIARIAATRLGHAARPLRLSYAGQCLRVRGNQLAPDRQLAQAGIELIGHDSPEADAEVVLVAAEALAAVGLTQVSFDLTMPSFVQMLLDEAALPAAAARSLSRALDRKDAAAVAEHGGKLAVVLNLLLNAAGPAFGALQALASAQLTPGARALAGRLADAVSAIEAKSPTLKLTVDPVEFRGFRYHTGVCSTVYAPGRHEELGRGGRYVCGEGEPATGLTLYPDAVLRAAPRRKAKQRVYVPIGTAPSSAVALRRQGYATVAALESAADDRAAAREMKCGFLMAADRLVALALE